MEKIHDMEPLHIIYSLGFQTKLVFVFMQGMTDWAKDSEFGRQKLIGTNPGLIKVCTELPKLCVLNKELHH